MGDDDDTNITSVNRVQVYGQDKYLVLKEIKPASENHLTKDDIKCDVACLVFDSSQSCSFEFIAHVYLVNTIVVLFFNCALIADLKMFFFSEILPEQKYSRFNSGQRQGQATRETRLYLTTGPILQTKQTVGTLCVWKFHRRQTTVLKFSHHGFPPVSV